MPSRKKVTDRPKRWLWLAGGICVLLLGVVVGWWSMSDSADDLLALDSPTPAQIRKIAVQLLVSPDMDIRARATAKLSGLGEKAKPVLHEVAVESRDPEVRFAVLNVLRAMDSAAAAEVVSRMIENADVEVRQQAVELAGNMSDAWASAVLEKALTDPDPAVRVSAAGSLDPRSSAAAADKLRTALNDSDPNVRRHAARSLRKLQTPRQGDPRPGPRSSAGAVLGAPAGGAVSTGRNRTSPHSGLSSWS